MKIISRISAALRLTANIKAPLLSLIQLKLLGSKQVVVEDKQSGVRMRTSADSFQILSETWYNRDYDVVEVPLRPGDLVIDVGANHGYFACYAAAKGAHVWAFEPAAENFERLEQNRVLNHFEAAISTYQLALGKEAGKVALYHLPQLGGAMHSTRADFASGYHPDHSLETAAVEWVEQQQLEQFLAQNGYPAIRLLKLDCEGAEMDILSGLSLQALRQIDCIVLEYHPVYSLKDLYALTQTWGCFEVSLANQLPWSAREMIKLVNKSVWQQIPSFQYGK